MYLQCAVTGAVKAIEVTGILKMCMDSVRWWQKGCTGSCARDWCFLHGQQQSTKLLKEFHIWNECGTALADDPECTIQHHSQLHLQMAHEVDNEDEQAGFL